jgi:hypothetical protein
MKLCQTTVINVRHGVALNDQKVVFQQVDDIADATGGAQRFLFLMQRTGNGRDSVSSSARIVSAR